MIKVLKKILIIIGIIVLLIIIDLICILNFNKPLFAIKENDNKYVGLLYDTYNCSEYSTSQIKTKGSKFTCAVKSTNHVVKEILDTTKNIDGFICAETLEQFYVDEEYEYFYSCMKGKYIIVKYEDGTEESVEKALQKGTIEISDLDKYNISYYKHSKE